MKWLGTAMKLLPVVGELFGKEGKEAGNKLKKAGKKIAGATNAVTIPPFLFLISEPETLQQFFDINPMLAWVVLGFAGIGFVSGNVVGLFAVKEGKRKEINEKE